MPTTTNKLSSVIFKFICATSLALQEKAQFVWHWIYSQLEPNRTTKVSCMPPCPNTRRGAGGLLAQRPSLGEGGVPKYKLKLN
jgi:hypothetical protein